MTNYLPIMARWAFTALLIAVASLAAIFIWDRYEQAPWTRDGHVRADVVRVNADVGGLLTEVAVHDNEFVHRGDLLFVVDQPRYAAALEEIDANIESAKATLDEARKEARRDLSLGDLVAIESHEQNLAKVHTSLAALHQAIAARRTAQINLDRTIVRAPVNGRVTNLDLHPGDFAVAGAQALALIDSGSIRIEGYFEETKLRFIREGDQARISLMGEPGMLYGHVDSISGGIADDQATNSSNLLRFGHTDFQLGTACTAHSCPDSG